MPRHEGDPNRVIIAETYGDAKAFKSAHPEYAEFACLSVKTLDYRLRGRKLQDYVLTPKVKARPEAVLIERGARFLVSLYGIADNDGDQAKHLASLDELIRKDRPGDAE